MHTGIEHLTKGLSKGSGLDGPRPLRASKTHVSAHGTRWRRVSLVVVNLSLAWMQPIRKARFVWIFMKVQMNH
jgi:hypothetical protein